MNLDTRRFADGLESLFRVRAELILPSDGDPRFG